MVPHTVEHKVSHREWDEVRIAAADFFDNLPHILSAAIKLGLIEADDTISGLIEYPTLVFENGSIVADEMWGVAKRRVWTSSHQGGVSGWDDDRQTYHKHFYGTERDLGALIEIKFTLTDEFRPVLTEQVSA